MLLNSNMLETNSIDEIADNNVAPKSLPHTNSNTKDNNDNLYSNTNKLSALETIFDSENSTEAEDSVFSNKNSKPRDEDASLSDSAGSGTEDNEEVTFSAFNKARAKKKYTKKQNKAVNSSALPDYQIKNASKHHLKKSDVLQLHSETQRLERESKVIIPDYTPSPIILDDILKKLPKISTIKNNSITLSNNSNNNNRPYIETITSTPLSKFHKEHRMHIELDDLPEINFLETEIAAVGGTESNNINAMKTSIDTSSPTNHTIAPDRNDINCKLGTLQLKNTVDLNLEGKVTLTCDSPSTSKITLTEGADPIDNNTELSGIERFKHNFFTNSTSSMLKKEKSTSLSNENIHCHEFLSTDELEKVSDIPGATRSFLRAKLKKCLLEKRMKTIESLVIMEKYDNEEFSLDEDINNDNQNLITGSPYPSDEYDKQLDSNNCSDNETMDNKTNDDCNKLENNDSSDPGSDESCQNTESCNSDNEDSLNYSTLYNNSNKNAHKAKRQIINDFDSNDSMDNITTHIDKSDSVKYNMTNELTTHQKMPDTKLPLKHFPDTDHCLLNMSSFENKNISQETFPEYLIENSISFNFESYRSQPSIPEGLKDLCSEELDSQAMQDELLFLCSGRFTQDSIDKSHNDDKSYFNNSNPQQSGSPVLALSSIENENTEQQQQSLVNSILNETLDNDIMPTIKRKVTPPELQSKYADYRRLAEFEEKEAELSGSDSGEDSADDSNEYGNELDEYEAEEGDATVYDMTEEKSKAALMHNRLLIQEEEAQIAILKEKFLHDEDIVEDGLRMRNGFFRKRKFNNDRDEFRDWDSDTQDDDSSDNELEKQVDHERRKLRIERENFFDDQTSKNLKEDAQKLAPKLFNQIVPKRSVSLISENTSQTDLLKYNLFKKTISGSSSLLNRIFSVPASLDSAKLQSHCNTNKPIGNRKVYVFQDTRSLDSNISDSNKTESSKTSKEQIAKRIKTSNSLDMECNISTHSDPDSIFKLIH